MPARFTIYPLILAIACLIPTLSTAQSSDDDLSKALANPLASLVSVPFQLDYNEGYGSADGDQWLLNIQPVIPFNLSEDWNLITRTIIPHKWQDDIAGDSGSQNGWGDTTSTFWFSPKAPTQGGWIWGLGPVLYLPTSTDDLLGPGEWGGGASYVFLKQQGPLTFGALGNHVWSFESSDINSTLTQPFLTYNAPKQWSYTLNSESIYDWNESDWTIPVNAMVAKLVKVGEQRIQLKGGLRYTFGDNDSSADGLGLRLAVTFLFPK